MEREREQDQEKRKRGENSLDLSLQSKAAICLSASLLSVLRRQTHSLEGEELTRLFAELREEIDIFLLCRQERERELRRREREEEEERGRKGSAASLSVSPPPAFSPSSLSLSSSAHHRRQTISATGDEGKMQGGGRRSLPFSLLSSNPAEVSPFPLSPAALSLSSSPPAALPSTSLPLPPLSLPLTARRRASPETFEERKTGQTKREEYMSQETRDGRTRRENSGERGGGISALIAVSPYMELTEEEMRTSLLRKCLGPTFSRVWRRWRLRLLPILVLAILFFSFSLYVLLLRYPVLSLSPFALHFVALGNLCSVVIWLIYCSSVMNFRLFMTGLRTFDTLFFLGEICLFAFSLWGVLCFEIPSLLLCLSILLATASFILYDSLNVSVRRSLRWFLVLSALCFVSILALMYR